MPTSFRPFRAPSMPIHSHRESARRRFIGRWQPLVGAMRYAVALCERLNNNARGIASPGWGTAATGVRTIRACRPGAEEMTCRT